MKILSPRPSCVSPAPLLKISGSVLAIMLVASSTVGAQTLTFNTIADGRVQSSGVLGKTLFTSQEGILTQRSGGNNISNGLFEFDLSSLPAGTTITGVNLLIRTSAGVSQIGGSTNPAPVRFSAFKGNGMLEIIDDEAVATLVANPNLRGTGNNTNLIVPFSTVSPVQAVINDADPTAYVTIRTETVDFVSFNVDSLESTSADAVAAQLQVTFTAIPEPSALALCLLGGAGFVMRRHR